jgi:hypothetical protein
VSEPRINEAARAELNRIVERLWQFRTDPGAAEGEGVEPLSNFLSRALPVEGEREDRLHDGSCDYCGAAPTTPRHVCVHCWESLGNRP